MWKWCAGTNPEGRAGTQVVKSRGNATSLFTLHRLESPCVLVGAEGGQLDGFDFPLAGLQEGHFHQGLTARMLLLTYKPVRQRVTLPCCLSYALHAK